MPQRRHRDRIEIPVPTFARDAAQAVGEVVADGARDRRYRVEVLALLAGVLVLDYADRSAVGALGPDLKQAFGISNTGFGFLASAFSIVGAVATIPAGILTDRWRRTAVLAGAVALWGLAMGATGLAQTFLFLVCARVFLGAVTATARPAVLSITGDVFTPEVRGQALGVIDSGELVGDGIGFLVAGAIAAFLSWRVVFFVLGAAGFVLVWFLHRLPEPPRSRGAEAAGGAAETKAERVVEQQDVEPDEELVLEGGQSERRFVDAFLYVLRVRTQVLVMVAVAIGSFFFAGVRTFIIIYAVRAYGVDRSAADLALLVTGLGAIVGILAGGKIGDLLVERGRLTGRLDLAAVSYAVAAVVLVPAFLLDSLWLALPLFVAGAVALSAPIPPLDAVRLDVVHPQLWGRAEAVRTVLLIVAEAGAPLLFGLLSDRIAGGGGEGLRVTFLLALTTLLAASAILWITRRFYPREVAAVAESR